MRSRAPHWIASVLVAGLIGAVVWIFWPASDVERAMQQGCDGLPRMAEAYTSGDRDAFDTAAQDAERLGFANFRAPDLSDDDQLSRDAATAAAGYNALSAAAYERAEANNGDLVWRGRALTSTAQHELDTALAVCSGY
jgi:hypothetical protein